MLLLIDNYDSFTYNLYHYLGELGAETVVHRNDDLSADDALAMEPQAIIISPGPCDPDRAGISLELVRSAAGRCPIFGVCLGHQSIGQAFGARVIRAPAPMHGKISRVHHDDSGVFQSVENDFEATRYHSLAIDDIPDCLAVNARTDDGVVMGVRHKDYPIHGVQFHPESIETRVGHEILANFLKIAGLNPLPVPERVRRAA